MATNNVRKGTVVIGLTAFLTFGAEIYVSPSGDDANNGSIGSPLKTLAAARDKADQLKAGNTPVTVYLRTGTYYLSAPIEFGPSNSGTAAAPIIYTAYQKEKVILSGGIKVTPSWTTYSGQIKVATIATDLKVDQLFLNGNRQVLARYPDYDTTKILDGYAGDCIGAARVALWTNPAEGPGYIRALHNEGWGGNSFIITGKSGSSVTCTWVRDNNRGGGMHSAYRMVENIFEELDAPGEWYYRKSTGQLFFYPPAGADLATSTIELASHDELIRVVGASAAKVRYLTFNGLTFTHTYRTLFSKPYSPLLRSDWRIARAGAVYMENAENIRIESCAFDRIGGNGVFINGYNRNHVIFNSTFIDAGATCVALCGLNSSVHCPADTAFSSNCTCDDKTPGPLTEEYPAFISVNDNTMYNFGRFEKQTSGVVMCATMLDTVRHNTIYKMPRAGITIASGRWGGHVIEYNWVYESVLETGDHGAFNAWGRDRNIRWPNDITVSKIDAMYTTTIRNNRFDAKPPFSGIYLNDWATNYLVYNNLCIGAGLRSQWNRYIVFVNNIVINEVTAELCFIEQSNFYSARNIFFGPKTYRLSGIMTNPEKIKAQTELIDSNCIYNSGNPPLIDPFIPWAQWVAAGLDTHSVILDPMFVDPAKCDYRVKDGSPALTLRFVNFPMDSFGVLGKGADPITGTISSAGAGNCAANAGRRIVCYQSGRLIVSSGDAYRMLLMTPSGRTVKSLCGNGGAVDAITPGITGAGIYFAVIRTNGRVETLRFLVNK